MRTMIATAVLVGSVGLFAQTSTGLDGRLPTVVVPAALTVCDSHEVAQRIARAAGIPLGFEAIPTCNVETHPPRLSGTWTFERKLAALSAIVAADHSRGWDAVMIERPTEFHRTTPVLIVGLRTSNPNVGGGAAYVLDPANLVAQ
jgi:hypothetical protein